MNHKVLKKKKGMEGKGYPKDKSRIKHLLTSHIKKNNNFVRHNCECEEGLFDDLK